MMGGVDDQTEAALDGLRQEVERIVGWAKAGKGEHNYLMDIGNVDRMAEDVLAAVRRHLLSAGNRG